MDNRSWNSWSLHANLVKRLRLLSIMSQFDFPYRYGVPCRWISIFTTAVFDLPRQGEAIKGMKDERTTSGWSTEKCSRKRDTATKRKGTIPQRFSYKLNNSSSSIFRDKVPAELFKLSRMSPLYRGTRPLLDVHATLLKTLAILNAATILWNFLSIQPRIPVFIKWRMELTWTKSNGMSTTTFC